ncbi:hypothetical protein EDB85DRAFT_1112215 [Lactarius pseudohatsudake]|nr:hypothetical protein EDB85DRAFT_1112215 [Lactarius pseudohatsudake]
MPLNLTWPAHPCALVVSYGNACLETPREKRSYATPVCPPLLHALLRLVALVTGWRVRTSYCGRNTRKKVRPDPCWRCSVRGSTDSSEFGWDTVVFQTRFHVGTMRPRVSVLRYQWWSGSPPTHRVSRKLYWRCIVKYRSMAVSNLGLLCCKPVNGQAIQNRGQRTYFVPR